MTDVADVVVFKVDIGNREVSSWGRDTKEVAVEFCRRPKWPAKLTEHFVGVDEGGCNSGTIVAATPSLSNWLGHTFSEFMRDGRFTR